MNHSVETDKITMYETQGCLVVPIQQELAKEAAQNLQRSLLKQIYSKNIKGVVIDLSGVEIIDSILWEIFSKTSQIINVIGLPSVISGLNPGVVASIIDLDLDINAITTALNLEDALEVLTQSAESDIDDTELVEGQALKEDKDDIELREVD